MPSRLPSIDKLSLPELNELLARIQIATAKKKDAAKNAIMAKLKAAAATDGFDLDELMRPAAKARRQRSDKGVKLKPKYIGPNGEIYTGRGPTPRWLKTLERSGEKRDKYLAR